MSFYMAKVVILLASVIGLQTCDASSKFLHDNGASLNSKAFQDEIMNAMGSMLGCGGQPDPEHISAIRASLTPMWRTLPKTSGRIDRRTLRYLVHRYFMQSSSLMVRGFEPTRSTNDSHWGAADILSQMVPAYVESVLESHHSMQNGFSLQDAVDMVLTLDQLIFDSASSLLEGVYKDQRKPLQRSLGHQGLKQVMEAYMIKWMIEAEPREHAMLLANRTLMEEIVPNYNDLMNFVDGRIKEFEFKRRQNLPSGKGKKKPSKDAFEMRYTFEDAHQIAGGITRSFQSFWQSECDTMKDALVGMDSHATGRVPLSKFYNTAINTDWRFGESESYLRELGALDETSSWLGPQVIIPNYLQATSNCIVSTPHYLVCCVNECETLMGDIELAIDAPTALPDTILSVVRSMSSQTTLDQDEPPHLDASLVRQLEQIARNHGGMVPLHGRLFAQWLHYVFPRECPFPHKTGVVTSATPSQYGENFVASQDAMQKHASNATAVDISSVGKEELQWMSQWSPEEELVVDYSSELGSSWTRCFLYLVGGLLIAGGAWGGALTLSGGNSKTSQSMGMASHAHWV